MFASEWEEELISEWLSLEGYFVEVNVPLTTGRGGGRKEADVIAIRADRDKIVIKHVEIGNLARNFEENLKSVLKKFKEDRVQAVINYVKSRFPAEKVEYKKIFVATYCGHPIELKRELEKKGVEFLLLREIVETEIPKAIENWKKNQQEKGLIKKKWNEIMLPRSYWLLKMIELMKDLSPYYTRYSY